jgi:ATP-binding protein involved in chromosome partitioning
MQEQIKHILLIASGKGGVGKSMLASNLAIGLSQENLKVGLLDADIYGPSLPTLFGEVPRPESTPEQNGNRHQLRAVEKYGIQLMSIGYLVERSTAMIWRGPMLAGAAIQLLEDVEWGNLDVLVVDLPPGTGDIQLSLTQKFRVSGSILCSTPQNIALDDVLRAKTMFDKLQVPILGLVENMSYFICHQCQTRHEIFAHGGAEDLATQLNLPLLGTVPLEKAVREAADMGKPLLCSHPETAAAHALREIARKTAQKLNTLAPPAPPVKIRGRRSLPIVSA